MAQLPQGLGLDLADPLPRHIKIPSHLFQRPGLPVIKAEPEAQYLLLPDAQGIQHLRQLLLTAEELAATSAIRSALSRGLGARDVLKEMSASPDNAGFVSRSAKFLDKIVR